MATYTEEHVEGGLGLSAAEGGLIFTVSECQHITLVDVAEYLLESLVVDSIGLAASTSDAVGYDEVSGLGLSSSGSNTVATNELVEDGVALGESSAQGQSADVVNAIGLAAAAVFSVDTVASSGIALADAAAGVKTTGENVESGLTVGDSAGTVFVLDVVDGIGLGETKAVVLEVGVTDSAGFSAQGSVGSFVVHAESTDVFVGDVPAASLVASQSEVSELVLRDEARIVDLLYPSMWANSQAMSVALWQQTPYESYAMHDGQLIAAGPAGIYAITGDLDTAAPVMASMRGDLTDLGSNKKKVFDAGLMSGKTGGKLRLSVETEMGEYLYDTDLPSASYPKTHRAGIGRGLTGRYVRFGMDNNSTGSEGASFSLDGITVGVADSERVR